LFIFFAPPKKTNQKKGGIFYEVFFKLFYRTPKNRYQSAKFFPRFQKFFTRFYNYTDVKASIRSTVLIYIRGGLFCFPYCILIILEGRSVAALEWNDLGCVGQKLL